MTNKFTTQQVLKMSGILLSVEYKSTRMRSSKVSGWNLFLSEAKADIPDHIHCPTKGDVLRPKFNWVLVLLDVREGSEYGLVSR